MNDRVTAEITDKGIDESDEWGFVGTVNVRLNNPDGKDIVAIKTYKTRPKYDDLTSEAQKVHESVQYWWPDSYPAQGDSPFDTQSVEWEPVADIEDDDALMEEILEHNAVYDPQAELYLVGNGSPTVQEKLGH